MHFRLISEYATFTRLPAGSLDPSSNNHLWKNMLSSPEDQVWFSDMPKAVSEYDGDEEEGRDAGARQSLVVVAPRKEVLSMSQEGRYLPQRQSKSV